MLFSMLLQRFGINNFLKNLLAFKADTAQFNGQNLDAYAAMMNPRYKRGYTWSMFTNLQATEIRVDCPLHKAFENPYDFFIL